jgi:hypothetical protein
MREWERVSERGRDRGSVREWEMEGLREREEGGESIVERGGGSAHDGDRGG